MNTRLVKRIIYISSVALTILTLFYCFIWGKYENTQLKVNLNYQQPNGYIVDQVFYPLSDFPITTSAVSGGTIVIQGTVPDYVTSDYSVAFQSIYCACEFSVNGLVIGSYGVSNHLPFSSLIGNIYVLIPLSSSMAGQTFTLRLTPYYSSSNMGITAPSFAPTGELKLNVLHKNLPRLLIIMILLTISLISMALFIAQLVDKSVINSKLFGNFLSMNIFVMLWLICSSDLPQFFTTANDAISLISFMCLAVMAVPYMGYCEQVLHNHRKYFLIMQLIGVFLPLINILLYLFRLSNPMDLLPLTHIYMLVTMVSSLILALTESNKTVETWLIISGIVLLVIASIGGLICYYLAPASGIEGLFFGVGFVCFITSLFMLILSRQITLIKERRHLDTYKTLAYSDLLTNLGNRSAFEHCFETLGERVNVGDTITLLMFDLNGLKSTNDTYGHQAGDEMIHEMATLLERHFLRYGSCFRLGGDEYAVVIERTFLDFDMLCESFQELLSSTTLSCGVQLSSSIGYATMPYNGSEKFRDTIYAKADAAMYEEKKKYHETHERRKI